jgi:Cu+-exporting ATPase
MTVNPATTPYRYQYQIAPFYCADSCRIKFAADPKFFLESKAVPAPAVAEGTIYTCPMHRRSGRWVRHLSDLWHGSRASSFNHLHSAQRRTCRHTRRFWIGLVLTLPVFVLEMEAISSIFTLINQAFRAISNLPSYPVVLWAGWPFFVRAHNRSLRAISTCSR